MIDCYVMPVKSGKTRTLVERAVREIVDNESCVVYINLDDTREYVYRLACDLLQLDDEFDAVKNRFKYLNVPYGKFNINTLAEICKMFQYEADIVIVDGADAILRMARNRICVQLIRLSIVIKQFLRLVRNTTRISFLSSKIRRTALCMMIL